MERGTEWEREAVRERWRELERRRHGARQLLRGTALLLIGISVVLLALVPETCVQSGPWPHGCMRVVPGATRVVLLAGGAGALASGLWFSWDGFRR